MEEFTRASNALIRATSLENQPAMIEVVAALRSVLRKMLTRIEELEARQGKLASEASSQAAQTVIDLTAPLAQQLDQLTTDVRQISERLEQLEAREVGAPPKE
jgi:phage shock protein A